MIVPIFIISFIVMAVWASYLPGEIFGRVREYGESHLPIWMHKPLFSCPICMTPYYGSAAYWLIYGAWLHTASWQELVVVILAAMGLNAIFVNIFRD